MKYNFKELSAKFMQNRNDILHAGYAGEYLDDEALQPILNEIEDEEIRHNLRLFFNLGQISTEMQMVLKIFAKHHMQQHYY